MEPPTKHKFGYIWTISGLFLSALVGAGFATGREIFIYFVQSGVWGMVGLACACLLLGFGAYWMFCCSYKLQQFKRIIALFTFCAYITMVAGFRDVLSILFPGVAQHNPVVFGLCACGIVTAFSLLIFYRGFAFFATLCKIITPVVIGAILLICGISLSRQNLLVQPNLKGFSVRHVFLRTVLYVGYNVLFLAGVLGRSDSFVAGKKDLGKGTALGTSLFWLSGTSVFAVLLCQSESVRQSAMPLSALVQSWSVPAGQLFGVVLGFAMLLSAASALCAAAYGCTKERFTVNVLALLAIPASYMGFDAFLSVVYPVFGIMGIFLLIVLAQTHKKNV